MFFVIPEKEKDKKKRLTLTRGQTEGSLTPEEVERYSKMLPSKTMIDKMAGTGKKRSSLFRTFKD